MDQKQQVEFVYGKDKSPQERTRVDEIENELLMERAGKERRVNKMEKRLNILLDRLQEFDIESSSSMESTNRNWFKHKNVAEQTRLKTDFIEKKKPGRSAIRKFYQLGY